MVVVVFVVYISCCIYVIYIVCVIFLSQTAIERSRLVLGRFSTSDRFASRFLTADETSPTALKADFTARRHASAV